MNTPIAVILNYPWRTEPPDQPAELSDEPRLERPRQAWQWMRQTLQAPVASDWVRREVADSWRRCLEDYPLRFQPKRLPPPSATASADTRICPALLDIYAQLEQQAGAHIGEAGLTLCLADADCRLVGLQGQELGDCAVGRLLGHPAADWSEPAIGNNGIGTAAVTEAAIAFAGEEHYLPLLHPFTSAGFPLFAANGELLAVLGLISDRRTDAGVLKSLLGMLGQRVEEALKRARNDAPAEPAQPFPLRIRQPAPPIAAAPPPAATLEQHLAEKAVRLQQRRIPILIVGESGAGKEHLVRMAYEAGPRRSGPFVALNCASLPRDLIESELFGYAAGSFTGARKEGKIGKFLLADKGVLFLDEIGDMGLDLQAVLLRVLESSEFFPVGASQPVKVDVQIFAATNVPIQQAVREGQFRRDLYYRLNGAQLILPPLRERPDKGLIIQRLLEKEWALSGKTSAARLADAVLDLFLRHPWPGNIRQLSNVIRSSLHMAEHAEISVADLPDDFFEELRLSDGLPQAASAIAQIEAPPGASMPITDVAMTLAEWEMKGIKVALESFRGNLTQTARALGITRGTLYKKLSLYGISTR